MNVKAKLDWQELELGRAGVVVVSYTSNSNLRRMDGSKLVLVALACTCSKQTSHVTTCCCLSDLQCLE